MHEMSIAQNIIEIVRQHLPDNHSDGVKSVKVRIGEMAGIVPDSLEFCFNAMVESSPIAGAQLLIDRVPISACCRSCGIVSPIEYPVFICSSCQGNDLEIVSGTELYVVEIELAESPRTNS